MRFKREKLENEKTLLEIEEKELRKELDSIKLNLDEQQKILEEEKNSIDLKIQEEKNRLDQQLVKIKEDFAKEKVKLEQSLEPLRARVETLNKQINTKDKQLTQLKLDLETKELATLYDQIAQVDEAVVTVYNDTLDRLIEKLKLDTAAKKTFISWTDKEKNIRTKVLMLYALYKAEENKKQWFNAILAELEEADQPDGVFGVLASGSWSLDDEISAIRFLIKMSPKLSEESLVNSLQLFQLPEISVADLKESFTVSERLKLFDIGRKVVLDRSHFEINRGYALLMVGYVLPEAYPVLIARILNDPFENVIEKSYFRQAAASKIDGEWSKYEFIQKTMADFSFDSSTEAGVKKFVNSSKYKIWELRILDQDSTNLIRYLP